MSVGPLRLVISIVIFNQAAYLLHPMAKPYQKIKVLITYIMQLCL